MDVSQRLAELEAEREEILAALKARAAEQKRLRQARAKLARLADRK